MPYRAVEQFRQNLAALIKARGTNQTALAFRLGVHTSVISKFLKGHRPSFGGIEKLDTIADELGVEPYQLFVPGIATERRSGVDRRAGTERRQPKRSPEASALAAELRRVGFPPPPERRSIVVSVDEFRTLMQLREMADFERDAVATFLEAFRRQKPSLPSQPRTRRRRRQTKPDGDNEPSGPE